MDSQKKIVTHYAILIGIDDYPDKPLKSCVRDVQNVKTYLESTLKDSLEIHALTASQALSDPAQDHKLWPTRENVTSAFKIVTSLAKAGDFVYIHYSGHGTEKKTSGNFSNGSLGDLALVLLGGEERKQLSCLWGFELADLLKAMVDNRMIITLILDCCFSGSVYRRDDPNIRFLPYHIEMDSRSPLDTTKTPGSVVYRDISMQLNWLIKPDRVNGKNYGALSYFLLKAVECVGLTRRHGDVYGHLRAKFRGLNWRYTPVLYGNQNQGFFGQVSSDITKTAIPIIVRQYGTLELQAGHAHGVKTDDQLVLYPLDSAEGDPRSQGNAVLAKIVSKRALSSNLELLGIPSIRVRTGWMARALTRSSLQRFPIRLASGLLYRDEWLIALRERSLDVYVDTDEHPFTFDVVLKNGEYKILDESGREIDYLTSISQDQTAIGRIGSILEHFARFRLVRELCNEAPADSFRNSFAVQIFSNGNSLSLDGLIEMEHNAIAELVVENKGNKDLYVFIYDFSPFWQVENANYGTYMVVTPQNNRDDPIRKKLRMMIPNQMREKGYRSCKDILKVFATSQPTSFDLLELPRLGELAKTPAVDRTSREGGDGLENWASLNFPIQISLQREIGIYEIGPILS